MGFITDYNKGGYATILVTTSSYNIHIELEQEKEFESQKYVKPISNNIVTTKDGIYYLNGEALDDKDYQKGLDLTRGIIRECKATIHKPTTIIVLDDTHLQLNQYIITLQYKDTLRRYIPVSCTCPHSLYRLRVCKHMICTALALDAKSINLNDISSSHTIQCITTS